ncbi:hypothetical protein AVEN_120515-1 [Araneus ventricosus]|uniref:Uncharacterized protein n=1 Tax=Araneus ventricosus TaxID=182803 RepID=A0A4Y2MSN6_ARAVE|nr:hypothetical protein AVEN_120515-1 [Araneus ventricosus]
MFNQHKRSTFDASSSDNNIFKTHHFQLKNSAQRMGTLKDVSAPGRWNNRLRSGTFFKWLFLRQAVTSTLRVFSRQFQHPVKNIKKRGCIFEESSIYLANRQNGHEVRHKVRVPITGTLPRSIKQP